MQQQRIPAALLLGLVIGFAGTLVRGWVAIVADLNQDFENAFAAQTRWDMFAFAAGIAGSMLVVVAMFGLASRLTGARRILLLVVGWVYLSGLVLDVAWPVIEMANPRE